MPPPLALDGKRLRLRPWRDADLAPLAAVNADPAVMRHFPAPMTRAQSDAWAARLQDHIATYGWGFWAVERRDTATLIGAVGLLHIPWAASFTPAVEIGWRIGTAHQRQGFAEEAARLALDAGFGPIGLSEIVAFTVPANTASRALMAKLGFAPAGAFDHPRLPPGHALRPHLLHRLTSGEWLGSLLQSRAAPSAPGRIDAAFRQGAQAQAGNPLGDLLARFGGAGGLGGMLNNLPDLAQKAFGHTATQVRGNNPVAVGGLGALAGAIMGGGRGAVGGGLLAALGSIAFAALQGSGQAPAAPVPDTEAAVQHTAILVLRGMIEAVKADGRVDAAEADRIARKLDEVGADAEARDWVRAQLASPADIDGLARDVATPQQAAQVYGAAMMAIEVDTPEEQAFMTRLSSALALPPSATEQIRRSLSA